MALMCGLIILSKLFSSNDVKLIGLRSFALVWAVFPALGIKTTFFSCQKWKIFFSQFIDSCPAC